LRIGVGLWFPKVARAASRIVLWLLGVELRIEGIEHITERKGRIILLNHSSQVELFIFGVLMPPYGTVLVKREFFFIPFFGLAFFAFDFIFVDRSDKERARASIQGAAKRLRDRRESVIIAPEGTRSRTGALGPFKMGAFHLAQVSGAPIVPVVIRGAHEVQPVGRHVALPGVIHVQVLPEIPTHDFTPDNLKEKRDAIREVYLQALAAGDSAESSSPQKQ
jgi:1-acyl-sn-glycerol-3-phosphate acyltransferase